MFGREETLLFHEDSIALLFESVLTFFPIFFFFSDVIGYSIQARLNARELREGSRCKSCSVKMIFEESLSFEYFVNRYSVND